MYDLKTDPQEMHNIYDDPEYAEVRANMHERLQGIREKYGDSDANDKKYLDAYMEVYNKRNSN
jgi:hypothetical protein